MPIPTVGHVFDDGPPPTGLRYCMNFCACDLFPKRTWRKEGYGEYLKTLCGKVKNPFERRLRPGACPIGADIPGINRHGFSDALLFPLGQDRSLWRWVYRSRGRLEASESSASIIFQEGQVICFYGCRTPAGKDFTEAFYQGFVHHSPFFVAVFVAVGVRKVDKILFEPYGRPS